MTYLGDFAVGATVRVPWSTTGADGSSITRATNGNIRVYKDGSTTQRSSSNGITDSANEDYDTVTGLDFTFIDSSDNTDAGFYAAGHDYFVALEGAVIDGKTVNTWLACFSIQNRYASGGLDAAGVRAAVGLATASLDAQLAALAGYIDTEIGTLISNVSTILAAVAIFPTKVGLMKNQAFTAFQFKMTDALGAAVLGLTNADFSKKEYSIGGAANGTLSGTITEDPGGEGFYLIDLANSEVNGRSVTLNFLATGTVLTSLTIITSQ